MYTFVLCWLGIALLVGYTGILRSPAVPMPVFAFAMTLTLLGLLAVRRDLRERVLSVGVRVLVAVHISRFVGFYFLSLYRQGLLPRDFAVPAGWGDIFVAVTAIIVLVAFRPETLRGALAYFTWNVLGLVDILMVLSQAARMMRSDPLLQGGFTSLPLILLPIFLVPIIIVTHVMVFVSLCQRLLEFRSVSVPGDKT
ncbi:MAG: hypothetical protein ABIS06_20355 [Vicinamibacterales bacterium]